LCWIAIFIRIASAIKKVSPTFEAGFNLVHQNSVSQGKREARLNTIKITSFDGSKGDDSVVTVLEKGQQVGGKDKRTPISSGGDSSDLN